MAAERLVINTGPLIALDHAEALELLARLSLDVIAPVEVRLELERGEVGGHRPRALDVECIRFVALADGLCCPLPRTSALARPPSLSWP